jgi:hypothetical protein
MSGFGKRLAEIKHKTTSLEEHGFSLLGIKKWRKVQAATGKPSALEDFFRLHGICTTCNCYGLQMTGWDEEAEVPFWSICTACAGSGRIAIS